MRPDQPGLIMSPFRVHLKAEGSLEVHNCEVNLGVWWALRENQDWYLGLGFDGFGELRPVLCWSVKAMKHIGT